MVYKNETITVNTAIGFTAANLTLAKTLHNGKRVKRITCTVEAAQIRAWDNGTPTATVGHILNIGDMFIVDGANVFTFRAIKTGSTNGIISVSYEI